MDKKVYVKPLIGLFLFCSVLQVALAAADDTQERSLRLVTSPWSPYVDDALPNNGLAIDLVTTALQRAGLSSELHLETWPRAYQGAASGADDVVAAIWPSSEREADLVFSDAYLSNDIIFLTRRGRSILYRNLDDLKGLKIGVVRQYAYGGGFDEYPSLIKVINNALIQNLLLLRSGQLDLVIGDRWSIFYQLSTFLPDTLEEFDVLLQPLVRRGLSIGVSRQNPEHAEIVEAFNKALRSIHEDGTYRQILARHTDGIAVVTRAE